MFYRRKLRKKKKKKKNKKKTNKQKNNKKKKQQKTTTTKQQQTNKKQKTKKKQKKNNKKKHDFRLAELADFFLSDKLHIQFLKYISRMNKKSPNITVLSEFGRYPLYVNVLVSTFKFLQRLSTTQSILLQGAYIESCITANQ